MPLDFPFFVAFFNVFSAFSIVLHSRHHPHHIAESKRDEPSCFKYIFSGKKEKMKEKKVSHKRKNAIKTNAI
jgi:hypothetical protein